jgi:hypothetical protein
MALMVGHKDLAQFGGEILDSPFFDAYYVKGFVQENLMRRRMPFLTLKAFRPSLRTSTSSSSGFG